jgi:hypothetical protein
MIAGYERKETSTSTSNSNKHTLMVNNFNPPSSSPPPHPRTLYLRSCPSQAHTLSLTMRSRSSSPEFSPLLIGEDLTPLPTYKAASTASVNFSGLLDPPLKLHEDLKSGCGGQLWPAGIVLAQHMLRYHKTSLRDSRMLVALNPDPESADRHIQS